jgi:hypothetical protein
MSGFIIGVLVGVVGAMASLALWANATALAEANGAEPNSEAGE